MIIVAGHIFTRPGRRDDFLAASSEAIVAARNAPGCRGFVVTADPLEADRAHVYEAWDDEKALMTFRGSGPDNDLARLIERVNVSTFNVSSND